MEGKAHMELTTRQLQGLHWKLPVGFLLQPTDSSDHRPSAPAPRRSDSETFKSEASASLTAKRPARVKRPVLYDDEEGNSAHSEAYRKIMSILQRVKRHPFAGPFLQPVDLNLVPDYADVIHEPMDLSTVEHKLSSGKYSSAYEFSADIRKIWSNAFQYNAQDTELYRITVTLSAFFEGLFKGCENLMLTDRNDAIEGLYKQVEALKKEIKEIKGTKTAPRQTVAVDRPMTLQEKKALGQNIRALQPQHLRGLISIIKDSLPKDIQGTELEFDIDTLSPKVCRELERYVRNCLPSAAPPSKSHSKKKSTNGGVSMAQDVNTKLEALAIGLPQKEESESESSSSESEEGTGALDPMFGGEFWPTDPHPRSDHADGFMMDFDQP